MYAHACTCPCLIGCVRACVRRCAHMPFCAHPCVSCGVHTFCVCVCVCMYCVPTRAYGLRFWNPKSIRHFPCVNFDVRPGVRIKHAYRTVRSEDQQNVGVVSPWDACRWQSLMIVGFHYVFRLNTSMAKHDTDIFINLSLCPMFGNTRDVLNRKQATVWKITWPLHIMIQDCRARCVAAVDCIVAETCPRATQDKAVERELMCYQDLVASAVSVLRS